jgi:hypothetical protein
MYTEAELYVLAAARGEPSVSALAEDLGRSVNEVTRLKLREIASTVVRDLRSEVLTADLKNDSVDHAQTDIPEIFQRLNMEGSDPKPVVLT